MVRLNVPEDQPLAVQQWQGLIAINYPARKFGLNRHITITEAQKLCPELIMQHVATWKEGEEKWAYHEDAFKQMATHKVSLDPYRMESKKILALIKEVLPAATQRVEKASVDEVFLDLSAQIHSILLERYPELQGPPPYDDPTENLPKPPTTALDWNTNALVDLDTTETEDDDPDWDDIAMLIGSEIVRSVTAAILERLHYTCSAGIARNKMLAKLGSGHKKPNHQTIIRNRAIQQFLSGFKFTKIRNLGGKLGDEVVAMFNTDTVKDLLEVPIEQLKKLGDETGAWLYQTVRGEDTSEVNPRTQIKSMLSAKSFRPSINTLEAAVRWIRIFVADIYSRLVEEGVLENKRKPRTMNLHHRQGAQARSKQAPIPSGKTIDEMSLFELAKNLLAQVIADGRAWPCANLSLSVGGFEDGPTGNHGIGGFLVRGEEAKAMMATSKDLPHDASHTNVPAAKRRRVDDRGIQIFFAKREESKEDNADDHNFDSGPPASGQGEPLELEEQHEAEVSEEIDVQQEQRRDSPTFLNTVAIPGHNPDETPGPTSEASACSEALPSYACSRCRSSIPIVKREEHEDWHFAKDLQVEEQRSISTERPSRRPSTISFKPRSRGRPPAGGVSKAEKGQRKLAFGQ